MSPTNSPRYPDEDPETSQDEHLEGDGDLRWVLVLILLATAVAVGVCIVSAATVT